MLEYDFNELDNDFITLWSKFLLTNDKKAIIDGIEALAELGQINAVQSWYLINQGKQNKNIDKILSSYNGSNFNEFLAMANAIDSKEINRDINVAIQYADDFCEKYIANRNNVLVGYLNDNSRYYKYLKSSFAVARDVQNNILVEERLAELLYYYAAELPLTDSERRKYLRPAKKVAKEVLKKMEYILNKEENVYEFLKNKPQLAFAVAKNHWFFSKKDKEKVFATDVLTDLSNRELSAETKKKIEEIKSRLLEVIEETKAEKKQSLLEKLNGTHWDEIKTVAPTDLGL